MMSKPAIHTVTAAHSSQGMGLARLPVTAAQAPAAAAPSTMPSQMWQSQVKRLV